ncbi:MAG: 3'(2'),5'-bisphosphate nucleotidase CysQ [Bacteroidetes bacterium]|nr:3'(2'),5'-bisphosphate nucleotidase CysQ [Bacteroidota bacterium]
MQVTADIIEILLQSVYEASDEIMKVYRSNFATEEKADRTPVTKADKISSEIICRYLESTAVLIVSEEEKKPDFETRSRAQTIWLVDPLDGTKEFIRKNDEFCINIALVKNGEPIFGLIASPVKKELIFGGPEYGAFHIPYYEKKFMRAEFAVKRLVEKKSRGLIFSRSHFTPAVNTLITKLEERYGPLTLIRKGSALKFFDLVHGTADFYPRMAPTMEWDIAAGHSIYRAVGGEVLDFTNFESLRYNKANLVNPYFIAKPAALRIN